MTKYRKEIETAQGELAQEMKSLKQPLQQRNDRRKHIHTCHGVALQEESDESKERNQILQVPILKKRTVCVAPIDLSNRKITPYREPKSFSGTSTYEYDASDAFRILMCWNLLRQAYSATNQVISRFVGWISLIFGKVNCKRTRITFLPPIRNPITDYSTVLECIFQSEKLAETSNMTYTHITVDAGAAAKFYHILWNNPQDVCIWVTLMG